MVRVQVITKEQIEKSDCPDCLIGLDMLHLECYQCTRRPGRKDNFISKMSEKRG